MIPVPPVVDIVPATIPVVQFYSQFEDISSPSWKKVGCGVASLAMVIDYYHPNTVSVDGLLSQAITAGAYKNGAGWKHRDLAHLSRRYGLVGTNYDLSNESKESAFQQLKAHLKDGPVIVSAHYRFDPKSKIPHLAVLNGIDGEVIYYNDPAEKSGSMKISTRDFLVAWKKRFIVVRPAQASFGSVPVPASKLSMKVVSPEPAHQKIPDPDSTGLLERDMPRRQHGKIRSQKN
jgi:ABC-type bacteriocin/lantibiotic exporter with double-glycine peptidase domain